MAQLGARIILGILQSTLAYCRVHWHITEYTGMLQSTLTEYTVHYQHATTTGAAIYQARMSVPGSRGT